MYVYCCWTGCREAFEPTEDSAAYCSWECAEAALEDAYDTDDAEFLAGEGADL